jgi:hypothetical protein
MMWWIPEAQQWLAQASVAATLFLYDSPIKAGAAWGVLSLRRITYAV